MTSSPSTITTISTVLSCRCRKLLTRPRWQRRVATVADAHGVFRVKGFVAVTGKPMRLLLQAVGTRVSHQYDRAWTASDARQGQLVVIGLKGLDRAGITRILVE